MDNGCHFHAGNNKKLEITMIKRCIICCLMMFAMLSIMAKTDELAWYDGENAVAYNVLTDVEPVVKVALSMFSDDMSAVTGRKAVHTNNAVLMIVELDKASEKLRKKLARRMCPWMRLCPHTTDSTFRCTTEMCSLLERTVEARLTVFLKCRGWRE